MQEQVEERSVAIAVKGTKLTGRALAKAMQEFLKIIHEPTYKKGYQSIESLSRQGASLSSIEVTGNNIGSFRQTARKYNIDFALKKDISESPPKWYAFFKGKDVDSLTAAFKEYSSKVLKDKPRKPSLLKKLAKFRERSKATELPVKHRSKGEHEI